VFPLPNLQPHTLPNICSRSYQLQQTHEHAIKITFAPNYVVTVARPQADTKRSDFDHHPPSNSDFPSFNVDGGRSHSSLYLPLLLHLLTFSATSLTSHNNSHTLPKCSQFFLFFLFFFLVYT